MSNVATATSLPGLLQQDYPPELLGDRLEWILGEDDIDASKVDSNGNPIPVVDSKGNAIGVKHPFKDVEGEWEGKNYEAELIYYDLINTKVKHLEGDDVGIIELYGKQLASGDRNIDDDGDVLFLAIHLLNTREENGEDLFFAPTDESGKRSFKSIFRPSHLMRILLNEHVPGDASNLYNAVRTDAYNRGYMELDKKLREYWKSRD